jgi:hypothetical protein
MAELKPCPFCGEAIKDHFPYVSYIETTEHWSLTHNCRVIHLCSISFFADTKEELIALWNRRN